MPAAAMPMPVAGVPMRTSGMAIAGFVLSFFCGVLGLIFSILGYNECKRSNGTVGGQGLAIAGIVLSSLFLLIGLLAVVAIPAFIDYMAKDRATEARIELMRLEHRAKSAYITNAEFPTVTQPLTPAEPCCSGPNHKCPVDVQAWQTEGWLKYDFEVDRPSMFQYAVTSTKDQFEAMAIGDPRCDGNRKTFVLRGRVVNGNPVFDEISER
jgi:type II secretory pathway pseudopilin PulG